MFICTVSGGAGAAAGCGAVAAPTAIAASSAIAGSASALELRLVLREEVDWRREEPKGSSSRTHDVDLAVQSDRFGV